MNKLGKKIIIAISLLAILVFIYFSIVFIHWCFFKGYIRMNYPSRHIFPVQGIDISHHQGKINWSKIDKNNIQFVFIKATEGGDFKDRLFRDYWKEIYKLDIPISIYHFFTFCRSGKEQAQHFIQEVPKEYITMLPAVDLEFGGNCRMQRNKDLLSEITDYIQTIEDYYQKPVIIYSTQDFYQMYLINQFPYNPIWIRDIYRYPKLVDRPWTFWQYTNRGGMDGINGFVDFNVFSGSKKEFNKILNQQPVKISPNINQTN